MHAVRHEDRGPQSHAQYFAQQNSHVRAAAATAESLSEFLHGDCKALAAIVGKWFVLPVTNLYRRRKLHEEFTGADDRPLADIGIPRAQVQWVVDSAFATTGTPPEQAADGATVVRLPVEDTKETADRPAEEPRHPMAA